MTNEISIIQPSKLQQQLVEPMLQMQADLAAFKATVDSKKLSSKYLTIPQVCELLHVSRSTIYRMVRNGDLRARKAYKRVLFSEKDIEKFLIKINL